MVKSEPSVPLESLNTAAEYWYSNSYMDARSIKEMIEERRGSDITEITKTTSQKITIKHSSCRRSRFPRHKSIREKLPENQWKRNGSIKNQFLGIPGCHRSTSVEMECQIKSEIQCTTISGGNTFPRALRQKKRPTMKAVNHTVKTDMKTVHFQLDHTVSDDVSSIAVSAFEYQE